MIGENAMSIIDTIKELDDLEYLSSVSEADITKAEKELELSFADEYKKYVSTFGVISANGIELTGVIASPRLNVVDVTKRERESNGKIPLDMYVVESTGSEGLVILQDQKGNIYSAFPGHKPEKKFNSLSEYLKSL